MSIPLQDEGLRTDVAHSAREADFLRGLSAAYRDLYVCVLSIVGNRTDADDVIQEVCVELWQKFDDFEPGTNFKKWACAFAFNIAKAYARQQRQRRGYGLSDHALAKLASVQIGGSELFELRGDFMRACLAKLKSKDHQFLLDCYSGRTTLVELAKSEGIPVATIYTRLKRLRALLVGCVNRSLGREEGLP